MPNRNVDGISKVACTSRHAPASDKLRTEHGRCAFLPRIIVPDLSIRLRGAFRWLAIGFRLDMTSAVPGAALLLHRTAVIWVGAPMEGVHRSPPRDGPCWQAFAAVPGSRIPANRKRHPKSETHRAATRPAAPAQREEQGWGAFQKKSQQGTRRASRDEVRTTQSAEQRWTVTPAAPVVKRERGRGVPRRINARARLRFRF